jgi:hypothetical protein
LFKATKSSSNLYSCGALFADTNLEELSVICVGLLVAIGVFEEAVAASVGGERFIFV